MGKSAIEVIDVMQSRGTEHEVEPAVDIKQIGVAVGDVGSRATLLGKFDHLPADVDGEDVVIALGEQN